VEIGELYFGICGEHDFAFGMTGAAFAWTNLNGPSNAPYTIGVRYGVDEEWVAADMLPDVKLIQEDSDNLCQPEGPRHPAWHPRETVFLFDAFGCIWRMDMLSRRISLFWPREPAARLEGQASLPQYSPDGKRVAFLLTEDSGNRRILCTDEEGESEETVASNIEPSGVARTFAPFEEKPFVWGPTSEYLIFVGEDGELKVATKEKHESG
jgi:hypothetical protein